MCSVCNNNLFFLKGFSMNITYDNLIESLKRDIPEFVQSKFYDQNMEDLPMLFLGDYQWYIESLIDENADEKMLYRSFNFLNKIAESEDDTVLDILGTEICIGIYSRSLEFKKSYLEVTIKYLSPLAFEVLDSNLMRWAGKDYMSKYKAAIWKV